MTIKKSLTPELLKNLVLSHESDTAMAAALKAAVKS